MTRLWEEIQSLSSRTVALVEPCASPGQSQVTSQVNCFSLCPPKYIWIVWNSRYLEPLFVSLEGSINWDLHCIFKPLNCPNNWTQNEEILFQLVPSTDYHNHVTQLNWLCKEPIILWWVWPLFYFCCTGYKFCLCKKVCFPNIFTACFKNPVSFISKKEILQTVFSRNNQVCH